MSQLCYELCHAWKDDLGGNFDAIFLLLFLVLLWLVYRRNALHRPGFSAGVFFAGYAIARFLVEFVRVADEQFISADNPLGYVVQFGSAGLSMGQLLSLPMLAFGLALIWNSRRQGA